MVECIYCKHTFSSKTTLNIHQHSAMYCLKIQQQQDINICIASVSCNFCDKIYTKKTLKVHLITCKSKKNQQSLYEKVVYINNEDDIKKECNLKIDYIKKECNLKIDNIKKECNIKLEQSKNECDIKLEQKNKEIDNLLKQHYLEKNALNTTIDHLNEKLEIYKESRNTINNTTNNNNNKIIIKNVMNFSDDYIKKIFDEKFTEKHMLKGQRGIARFAFENLLKDMNGELSYVCTDPSRQIFKYKTTDDIIEKDIKAIKLSSALYNHANKTSHGFTLPYLEKLTFPDFLDRIADHYDEIKDMNKNNSVFRSELTALTCK